MGPDAWKDTVITKQGLESDGFVYVFADQGLVQDNFTLMDTKSIMKEQLAEAQAQLDELYQLEEKNLQLTRKLWDLELVLQAVVTHVTQIGAVSGYAVPCSDFQLLGWCCC